MKKNKKQIQVISKLKKMGFIKNNSFKVRVNSSNQSIKKGDIVITFEIHHVLSRYEFNKNEFECATVLPVANYQDKRGFGYHPYIKHNGSGQQGITKLLRWGKR